MPKTMILGSLEYWGGQYQLTVLTDTKAQARSKLLGWLKSNDDGVPLTYYHSLEEWVDAASYCTLTIDEAKLI